MSDIDTEVVILTSWVAGMALDVLDQVKETIE